MQIKKSHNDCFSQTRDFAFIALVFLTSCVHNQTQNDIYSRSFSFNNDKTCMLAGYMRVCDFDSTQSPLLFLQAFNHNSQARIDTALALISNNSQIRPTDISQLTTSTTISDKWNAKLKIIANRPPIQSSTLLNIPETDLRILNKMLDADLPPIVDIDLSSKNYSINKTDLKKWIVFFKNDSELEHSCQTNGKKIPCSEMFQSPDTLVSLEEMGEIVKEDSFQKAMKLVLTFIRFQHDMNESFKKEGRRVYIVKSTDFSPQVDFLGNLYIPENFETLYTLSEQDLIMSHEAAHVAGFFIDYILALSKDVGNSIEGDLNFDNTFNRIIPLLRQPDEMLIDLIAASSFAMEARELELMANLISKFESSIEIRGIGLQLVSELCNESIKPSELLQNRVDLMLRNPIQNSPPINKIELRNATSKKLVLKYRETLAKYAAYRMPSYIVGLTEEYSKIDMIRAKAEVEKELLIHDCSQFTFSESNGKWFNIKLCTLNLN